MFEDKTLRRGLPTRLKVIEKLIDMMIHCSKQSEQIFDYGELPNK